MTLIGVIVIAIFGAGYLVLFTKEPAAQEEFNSAARASEVTTKEVYCLIGPFADMVVDNVVKESFYIAVTEDEWIVLKTGKSNNTGVPILWEDIEEDDMDSLTPVTVKGKGEYMEEDINELLAEYYNELVGQNEVTAKNVDIIFGTYYLNTTDLSGSRGEAFSMMLVILIIVSVILIIIIIVDSRNNKNLMKGLKVYEESGKLAEYDEDFINAKSDYNKKLKVLLTKKYLYSLKTDLLIIPLDDIINVYGCCMINNQINEQEFITLETKSGSRYFMLPKQRERSHKDIDTFREQLKEIAKENSYDSRI